MEIAGGAGGGVEKAEGWYQNYWKSKSTTIALRLNRTKYEGINCRNIYGKVR
jgi:hypothetical protein